MRWLRRKLAELWYWRHRVALVQGSIFSGNFTLWCRHCGELIQIGNVAFADDDLRPRVIAATCPYGAAWMRLQTPVFRGGGA